MIQKLQDTCQYYRNSVEDYLSDQRTLAHIRCFAMHIMRLLSAAFKRCGCVQWHKKAPEGTSLIICVFLDACYFLILFPQEAYMCLSAVLYSLEILYMLEKYH